MALAFESPMSQSILGIDSRQQRPQSALARGVQITELSDGCMNPEPIVMQESDFLMEQYLSPTKLQLLSGSDNLEDVETLELKVDTSETTLNNFGALLPNLRVLKLSGSVIPKIRDLGSSLRRLEVLWMSRCGLEEVDGISSMLNLRELYLSYNEISDISPLSMLEELQILDLEGNNIDDIGQVQYLTLCPKLIHLTLDGNPVCVAPAPDSEETGFDYRLAVKKILPFLETLDDKPVAEAECSSPLNVFEADWAYLEELQQEAVLVEAHDRDKEAVSESGRPTTAALRPATSYRPGSALKPSSALRPGSAAQRPASISGGRPSSAWTENSRQRPASSDAIEGMESSSELTCGNVICGNPSKALRARRKGVDIHDNVYDSESGSSTPITLSESSASARLEEKGQSPVAERKDEEDREAVGGPIEEKDLSNLLQELVCWKREHEKRLEQIRQSKAPQVFTVDHNGEASDVNSDLSDTDDGDARPDSAMDRYCQQQEKVRKKHISETGHSAAGSSFYGQADEAFTTRIPSEEEEGPSIVTSTAAKLSSHRLKDNEHKKHVLDEDKKLLGEYERLREISRKFKGELNSSHSPRELSLKELRIPNSSPRPPSPRRPVNPFPTSGAIDMPYPLGQEPFLSKELRPKRLRIGPTGLPGSPHVQQPQIRNILTHSGNPNLTSLGHLISQTAHRPSSTTLQHRIRRTLPEVPPLPSRPPPITKS